MVKNMKKLNKKIEEVKYYPERQRELDKQYGKILREEFEKTDYYVRAGWKF